MLYITFYYNFDTYEVIKISNNCSCNNILIVLVVLKDVEFIYSIHTQIYHINFIHFIHSRMMDTYISLPKVSMKNSFMLFVIHNNKL